MTVVYAPISSRPIANPLTGEEQVPINQAGTTNLAQGMLINTNFVTANNGRRYQVSSNSTFVKVKFSNKLVADTFEFSSNQTTAGSYSLFYTAS